MILCGYGRVGSAVAEALETFGVRYVVIETDPDIVRGLRTRGIPSLFGDASHARLLHTAGAEHAALAVVALPELDRVRLTVRKLRQANPSLPILARSQDRAHHTRLREAGASEVIQPELEAASTLIRHALRRLDLPRERVLAYLEQYREAMEAGRTEPARPRRRACPRCARWCSSAARSSTARCTTRGSASGSACRWSAIVRADGTRESHPSADTVLREGDRVRLFGLAEQLDTLLAYARGASERVSCPSRSRRSVSDGGVAAADAEGLPGDPRGQIRGEERDRGRDVPRTPQALDRVAL